MIRPDGFRGAAFGTVTEGDLRVDDTTRRHVSAALGIAPDWAFVTQVHGADVVEASQPGRLGEADAIYTVREALPVAVATADCVPVILEGPRVAAVVHAGWRGAANGVVGAALTHLTRRGLTVERAAVGPAIGPCCYEVGPEVAREFPGFEATTTWDTTSIDLPGVIAEQLGGLPVWRSDRCTFTSDEYFSFRRDRTPQRQVAVAWIPGGGG